MGLSSTIDVHTGDGSPETFKPILIGSTLNSNSPSDPATFHRAAKHGLPMPYNFALYALLITLAAKG